MKLLKSAVTGIYLLFFVIASFLSALLVYVFWAISWLIPMHWWRHRIMGIGMKIPMAWLGSIKLLLYLNSGKKWHIQGNTKLSPKKSYILISNHQTWADIPVLGYAFSFKTPALKFFMKRELLWSLPLLGLGCWMLDYPFMVRHTREDIRKNPSLRGKDIETTKKACDKFKEHPTTIMNFLEGTRFTEKKRQRKRSPYKHLLQPKAGGFAIVVNEMSDHLAGILNVTLHYSEPNMTFWKLLTGDFNRITINYELIPITHDLLGDYHANREYRMHFQQWLNAIWERKDQQLDTMN